MSTDAGKYPKRKTTVMDTDIDALLERYLALLDEYTKLRESLGSVQSGMYQNLARANFSAERGMRYGPDRFDERMQAIRRVRIAGDRSSSDSGGSVLTFAILTEVSGPPKNPRAAAESSGKEEYPAGRASSEDAEEDDHDHPDGGDGVAKSSPAKVKDPLRWFGILTPTSLRLAQAQAVQLVEEILPRLASVGAEMAHVEIEVRRARKKRARAAVHKDGKARQAEREAEVSAVAS